MPVMISYSIILCFKRFSHLYIRVCVYVCAVEKENVDVYAISCIFQNAKNMCEAFFLFLNDFCTVRFGLN